jgi:hypothetical protein
MNEWACSWVFLMWSFLLCRNWAELSTLLMNNKLKRTSHWIGLILGFLVDLVVDSHSAWIMKLNFLKAVVLGLSWFIPTLCATFVWCLYCITSKLCFYSKSSCEDTNLIIKFHFMIKCQFCLSFCCAILLLFLFPEFSRHYIGWGWGIDSSFVLTL